jgi:hypothetical protein
MRLAPVRLGKRRRLEQLFEDGLQAGVIDLRNAARHTEKAIENETP